MQLTRHTAGVAAPLPAKILQFGGGNFLRAYFDWMVELMNERTDFAGGVVVVKPTEGGHYADLIVQDGLFHVVLTGISDGALLSETRLVTCISDVVHPYANFGRFVETAGTDITYLVSNTTEAGIRFVTEPWPLDRCAGEFPGKLTQWLYFRWQGGGKGCHVLPLELIEDNGNQLKDCVLQYARHWELEPEFQQWVDTANRFYNTLVDRIVSGYPDRADELCRRLGFRDKLLVAGEYYHSLIIEAPPTGIPGLPLKEAGIDVVYTEDLAPYRERKVRLLNGAHTAMVPTGYLAGLDTVGEVMNDSKMSAYLSRLLYDDIIPTLDQPEEELEAYAAAVLDRFRNPSIEHRLLDISLNGTHKFRTRLLPSLLDHRHKFNALPPGIVRALSALLVFYRGLRGAETIPLRDDADRLAFFQREWETAQSPQQLVTAVLGREDWWGLDLNLVSGLTLATTTTLEKQLE